MTRGLRRDHSSADGGRRTEGTAILRLADPKTSYAAESLSDAGSSIVGEKNRLLLLLVAGASGEKDATLGPVIFRQNSK